MLRTIWGKGDGRGISGFAVNRGFTVVTLGKFIMNRSIIYHGMNRLNTIILKSNRKNINTYPSDGLFSSVFLVW